MTESSAANDRAYHRSVVSGDFADTIDARVAFNQGWNAVLEYNFARAKRNLAGQVAQSAAFAAFLFGSIALLFTAALWHAGNLAQPRGTIAFALGLGLVLIGVWLVRLSRRQAGAARAAYLNEWG